jgi:hypothetical protein
VFDDAIHGRDPRYAEWLDVVKVPRGGRPMNAPTGNQPAAA